MLRGESSSTVAHMLIPVEIAGIEGVETWQTVTGEHEPTEKSLSLARIGNLIAKTGRRSQVKFE